MKNIENYFKVFADRNRLTIIEQLLKGETCSCTIIDKLTISQPTLSYHLNYIAKEGLATSELEGNYVKYYIDKTKIDEMITYLEQLRELESIECKL